MLSIVIGFFSVIIAIMISAQSNTDHEILSVMAGTLGTTFANIVYAYFKKHNEE